MDLSQSGGNYVNSSSTITTTTTLSSTGLAGIKSVLNSPVAIHGNQLSNSLRVVHQKRQNLQNSTSLTPNVSNVGSGVASASVSAGNDRVPSVLSDADLLSNSVQFLAERYLLLNQIAGSSFYECVDVRTGEPLVCKAIGSSYSKILSAYFRLDGDQHVKPLHKLLQVSDQTYIFLPPSQFGDLHSFVRERKRLRESEARLLFRQICQTVKSCHDQGIVLRDIKLRKFVFSDRNRTHLKFESLEDAVVLEDPDDDILKEKIGCPAYVAPEILKPNSDFSGKAADLWSLGVVLYTMLVGRYPFNDPEHASLFAKIARCQFTIPDYLSSKARCLIKSLLQKVPKHRLSSDDVLYHPWLLEEDDDTIATGHLNQLNNNWINDLSPDDQRVPELDSMDFT